MNKQGRNKTGSGMRLVIPAFIVVVLAGLAMAWSTASLAAVQAQPAFRDGTGGAKAVAPSLNVYTRANSGGDDRIQSATNLLFEHLGQVISPTDTATSTFVVSPTDTVTPTIPAATSTFSYTFTPTPTFTSTSTSTNTRTSTPIIGATLTSTISPTVTSTITPTVCCIATPYNMTHWFPLDEQDVTNYSWVLNRVGPIWPVGVHVGSGATTGPHVGSSLNFNGENFVAVPPWQAFDPGTGDFSYDVWIKTGVKGAQVFIDKRTFSLAHHSIFIIGYLMFIDPSGKPGIQLADNVGITNYVCGSGCPAINNNQWHMVAVTVRRSPFLVSMYVNGISYQTWAAPARTGNLNNKAEMWVGRESFFGPRRTSYFRGSLDELEFFNRELMASEIKAVYDAGTAGKCKAILPPIPRIGPRCTWCYDDVLRGSTFYPYVSCLTYRGVLGGYPCGFPGEPCNADNYPYFRPASNMTRGQAAKVVANTAGLAETPTGQSYADVPPSHPFYVWIMRLTQEGYMTGYPCGGPGEPCDDQNRPYFRPGNLVTRGQLSKIGALAAGFNETPTGQTFTDVPPSQPFYTWVEQLAAQGGIGGYPCGGPGESCDDQNRPYFRPNGNVTRGQAAKIIANTFSPDCWIEPDLSESQEP